MQVHAVEDRVVSIPGADITVRIYTPDERESYPLLMFYHGGAFFCGNLESHDDVVREICVASGHKVISVDYRLAPEHPFPVPLEDCYNVTKWAADHGEELKWDGKNLAIAGDSSGGNLVAAITLMAREKQEFKITKQVLFYPSLDLDFSEMRYDSWVRNGKGYFLDIDVIPKENSFYLSGGADVNNPLVSPIRETNLSGLPPALIVTAEYDPFVDEGELYAANLKKCGVPVVLKRYEGATHGFLGRFTHLEEYKGVYKLTGDFLNSHI